MSKAKFDKLIEEQDGLFDDYIATAKAKECKQSTFLKRLSVFNKTTGETFQLKHSLQKKMIEAHSILEQRIGFIHHLAKEQNLNEVFFLTITAPSQFHPFKTVKGIKQLNKNFTYDTLREAIPASYIVIEEISRQFYKALKERLRGSKIDDQLLFVKVNEFHNTFIVHQHLMIMLPKDVMVHTKKRNGKKVSLGAWARAKFYEILKKNDFNYSTHPLKKSNDFKKIIDDGRSISKYMVKYIQKTLTMTKTDEYGSNDTLYFLYGWKTAHKIRHFSTSRVPFNNAEYKKLYYILKEDEKTELIERAKKQKTNLMIELSKIISIKRDTYRAETTHQRIIAQDGGISHHQLSCSNEELLSSKQPIQCLNPIFTIETKVVRTFEKITETKNYFSNKHYEPITRREKRKLVELVITKNRTVRYQKSDFIT